jgi:hypothetical protein
MGSTISNGARCSGAIKFRIAWKKQYTFSSANGFKLKEETSKVMDLKPSFMWSCNLGTSESRSETP